MESCLSVLKAHLNASASGPLATPHAAKEIVRKIDAAIGKINQVIHRQAKALAYHYAGAPSSLWLPTHGPAALEAVVAAVKKQQSLLLSRLQYYVPSAPALPPVPPPPSRGAGAGSK